VVERAAARFDLGDGAMLFVALVWAGNNVLAKSVLGERIDAYPYVFLRFVVVASGMFLWLGVKRQNLHVDRADYGQFILTGITGHGAYNLLFAVGLSHTSAFAAAILVSLGPVFSMIFATILGIDQVRAVQWFGVACAFAGVALFMGEKLFNNGLAAGGIYNLLGAIVFAIYGLATRPIVKKYGSPVVTLWSSVIGLASVAPFTLHKTIDQDWSRIGVHGWVAVLYAGIMSLLVGYTLWGWAIERRGIARTVPFLYVVPIATGILSVIFLDESIDAYKIGGAALVLAGVTLARRGKIPGAAVKPSPATT
jgi:O-acetylserine/cysteine efflux transporter